MRASGTIARVCAVARGRQQATAEASPSQPKQSVAIGASHRQVLRKASQQQANSPLMGALIGANWSCAPIERSIGFRWSLGARCCAHELAAPKEPTPTFGRAEVDSRADARSLLQASEESAKSSRRVRRVRSVRSVPSVRVCELGRLQPARSSGDRAPPTDAAQWSRRTHEHTLINERARSVVRELSRLLELEIRLEIGLELGLGLAIAIDARVGIARTASGNRGNRRQITDQSCAICSQRTAQVEPEEFARPAD